jgi:hypothetical protein
MDWNKSPKNPVAMYPTPTCADATMGAILNDNTKLIMLKSGKLRKISNQGVSGSIGLARTVAMWPTPCATDYKGAGKNGELRDRLDYAAERGGTKSNKYPEPPEIGGTLNPTWVEWLMGWPIGWTDLKPLATDKFRKWRHSHGKF